MRPKLRFWQFVRRAADYVQLYASRVYFYAHRRVGDEMDLEWRPDNN